MFGVRLPGALTAAFIDQALKASEGIAVLSAAMRGLIAGRTAVMDAVAAIDADIRPMTTASKPAKAHGDSASPNRRPRLCCNRRSFAHPPVTNACRILASFQGDTSPGKSTMSAASQNAETDVCGPAV